MQSRNHFPPLFIALKWRLGRLTALTVLAALAMLSAHGTAAPIVSDVDPVSGSISGGTLLSISGSGFLLPLIVTIGSGTCTIDSSNTTFITCTTPSTGSHGTVLLRVHSDGEMSPDELFVYVNDTESSVSSIDPSLGEPAGGFVLSVVGEALDAGVLSVFVGEDEDECESVTVTNASYAECTAPAGSGEQIVVVRIDGTAVGAATLVYYDPVVLSVTPERGPTGGDFIVELVGDHLADHFGVAIGNNFGADVVVFNRTHLVFTAPDGIGADLPVRMGMIDGTLFPTTSASFSYFAPSIDNVLPKGLPTLGASDITISGANFGAPSHPNAYPAVVVGGFICTNVEFSATQILCSAPPGSGGRLAFYVSVGMQFSNVWYLDYLPPSITSYALDNGIVILEGFNFGPPGTATVTIDDAACPILQPVTEFHRHDNITCEAPPGVTLASVVRVTVSGQFGTFNSGAPTQVVTPTLVGSSLSLVDGQGSGSSGRITALGDEPLLLSLQISGFVDGAEGNVVVKYGVSSDPEAFTCAVTGVTGSGSQRTLTCSTEGHEVEPVIGAVIEPFLFTVFVFGARSAFEETNTLSTTAGPEVLSVSGCQDNGAITEECPLSGGLLLHLTGERFGVGGNLTVILGSRICPVVEIPSATSAICRLPASTGGVQLITAMTVTNTGQQVVGTPRPLVAYRRPAVEYLFGCSPVADDQRAIVQCAREGEEEIVVLGHDFAGELSTVTVGGEECTGMTVLSPSEVQQLAGSTGFNGLRCLTPPGTALDAAVDVLDSQRRASSKQGSLSFTQCPEGTQSAAGVTTCAECSPGRFQPDVGQTACLACAVGRAASGNGSTECTLCEAGTVAATQGASECTVCLEGTVQALREKGSCDECLPGTFANTTGLVECLRCPAGSVAVGIRATECVRCAAGTLERDRQRCDACAVGRHSLSPEDSECSLCDAGKFANTTGQTECAPCPVGRSQVRLGSSVCEPCAPGRFANTSGLDECHACAGGSVARGSSATKCVVCSNGTIEEDGASCKPCSIGKYSRNPTDAACTLCDAGSFASAEGMSACEQCAAGKAQSQPGQASCLNCTAGMYAAEKGSPVCSPCKAGTVAEEAGATGCVLCSNGTIEEDGASCKPCSIGKYSDNPSDAACTLCDAGSFASAEGMSACEQCAAGKAQSQPGQASCLNCTAGRYAAEKGSPSCTVCFPGEVAEGAGATGCERCPNGTIAIGSAACRPCPPGSASSDPRDERCADCAEGTIADTGGMDACRACPPGRFVDREGGAVCFACPTGTFSQASASKTCQPCARNFEAPSEGSKRCAACVAQEYTLEPGTASCARCSSGRYTVFEEDAAEGPDRVFKRCEDCPAGSSCSGRGLVLADDDVWVVRAADGSVSSTRCLPGRCERCSDAQVANSTSTAVACCSKNRAPADTNPMCARCAGDFVEWGGECIECKETNSGLLVALLLLMWLLVLFMHMGLNQQSNPLSLIFFYYVQMVLLLFGEETGWLAWTSFFNFNPIQNASGGRCVAPWSGLAKLAISAVSPALTWVFLGFTAAIHAGINVFQRSAGVGQPWARLAAPYWRSCLAFFLFTYNNLANSSLRFFECVDVANGRWRVVRSAPEIDCRSDEYAALRPLFGVCLGLVAAGPLVLVYWLRRPKVLRLSGCAGAKSVPRDEFSEEDKRFVQVWGILFEMYRGDAGLLEHMWNAVVLVRRVLVVAVSILMLQYGHRARYAALTITHMVILLTQLARVPFKRMTLTGELVDDSGSARNTRILDPNYLELVSLVLLVVFSAVVGAVDLPFSHRQSIALASIVFAWMAVLMMCIIVRIYSKRRALAKKRVREEAHDPRGAAMHASSSMPFPATLPRRAQAAYSASVGDEEDLVLDPPEQPSDEEPSVVGEGATSSRVEMMSTAS